MLGHYIDTTKHGYERFGWLFNIIAVGTLIGTQLGLSGGITSVLAGFVFFYWSGLADKTFNGKKK